MIPGKKQLNSLSELSSLSHMDSLVLLDNAFEVCSLCCCGIE